MAKSKAVAPDTEEEADLKDQMEAVAHSIMDEVLHPKPHLVNGEEVTRPVLLEDKIEALKVVSSFYATIKKLPAEKTKPKFLNPGGNVAKLNF